jgi:sugar lactone lactonase YvrE
MNRTAPNTGELSADVYSHGHAQVDEDAVWHSGTLQRVDIVGRSIFSEAPLEVLVSRVTRCTFGGPDFGLMFLSSARPGPDENAVAGQASAGSIFVAQTAAQGFPLVRSAG